MVFPFDFGFIPSTAGGDGDPLDVMVLMDEPAHVGCLIEIRLIGVIEAEQTENGETKRNDRLLAAAVQSFSYQHVSAVGDLGDTMLEQIEEFFANYNRIRGKEFRVLRRGDAARAVALVQEGETAFRKKHG
jgi:inorganic pyrophosphatase